MLTVLDEYTRECRCIHVERRINADKVRQVMARVVIEDWCYKYNHIRPHRSLGYVTPIQFAGLAIEACPLTVPAASVRRSLAYIISKKH